MKKLWMLAVCGLALAAPMSADQFAPARPGEPVDHVAGGSPRGGPTSITQSVDTATITFGNSVACPSDDDRYLRRFDLDGDFGITQQFDISSVDIGVESNTGASVTVNLYTIAAGDPLLLANLTPIGSELHSPLTIPDLSVGNLTVSGSVLDPVANDLVVEIEALDFTNGFTFFIGSNAGGQTGLSYLQSVVCGAAEPTDTGTVGFPNMHIVMSVNGTIVAPLPPVVEVPTLDWLGLLALVALLAGAAAFLLRRS